MIRDYKTLKALCRGEAVEIDGSYFKMDGNGEVAVGDFYIAERNTGPVLLQAKLIDRRGWVEPTTMNYSYDTPECIKVICVPAP